MAAGETLILSPWESLGTRLDEVMAGALEGWRGVWLCVRADGLAGALEGWREVWPTDEVVAGALEGGCWRGAWTHKGVEDEVGCWRGVWFGAVAKDA